MRKLSLAGVALVCVLNIVSCETRHEGKQDSGLPVITSNAFCPRGERQVEDYCCALARADDIVYGRIVGIIPNTSPTSISAGSEGASVVGECDGTTVIGMKVLLDVESSIGHNERSVIGVLVGPYQMQRYVPMPIGNESNQIVWIGAESGVGGILESGMSVGMVLHSVDVNGSREWTILSGPMFSLDNDNCVKVQEIQGGCSVDGFFQADGKSLEKIYNDKMNCYCGNYSDGTDGLEDGWWLPICLSGKLEREQCHIDADCGSGQKCNQGICE